MLSNLSDRRISPLRARMIEDMTVRGFTEKTRQDYVRHAQAFAAFIGRSPATATPDDIRGFQLHQRQSGMQPPSINTAVSALRLLFTVTLDRLFRHDPAYRRFFQLYQDMNLGIAAVFGDFLGMPLART